MFAGLSGNTWAKIAHGSDNDVRRLCWPNFRDIDGLQLVLNSFTVILTSLPHTYLGKAPLGSTRNTAPKTLITRLPTHP